ncbi:hypothetical protein JCM3775_002047 [Rhodotorula graminis]|uniref:RNase III domain-containing protein n=1 Tax=Rhodotorula graminis (strain WP1) TaxID=578459 RepID=A0A194S428_RHOGW|nr:uncharacterized protein RHOBADRAFT_54025 [Rhodotorula graminis WP1]KPV74171.1 hypothetical protein RHOBADRAFT_54025 [Rhodotorula graminis WP1]
MSNAGHPEARAALAAALPSLAAGLPPAPVVADPTYLTHSSAHGATHWKFEAPVEHPVQDYERLEHVGDALLGAEVTLMVHEAYPQLVVGVRSLVKSSLVENELLALLSSAYGLPDQIRTAWAQSFSLRANPSVRACVFEAYLAAVYEEHGHAVMSAFVREVFKPLLPVAVEAMREVYVPPSAPVAVPYGGLVRNPVSALYEWTQRGARRSLSWGAPEGIGPPHCRTWSIQLCVKDGGESVYHEGVADTVKAAKHLAAMLACAEMDILF